MYNEESDLILLQKGSAEAFERIFHQYSGKLYHFVLKLAGGNRYLAEEMVQRTFIKIWEGHTAINPQKTFISYLCTVAKNMLLNEFEHQTIEYLYQEYALQYLNATDNSTEHEVNRNLLEEYIDKLTEKLPPARRRIFIMSRKEMLSNKEIAEKLQISESTIQTQLSKALAFMRENLTQYYDTILLLLIYNGVN